MKKIGLTSAARGTHSRDPRDPQFTRCSRPAYPMGPACCAAPGALVTCGTCARKLTAERLSLAGKGGILPRTFNDRLIDWRSVTDRGGVNT
jgi:hypothetical protein